MKPADDPRAIPFAGVVGPVPRCVTCGDTGWVAPPEGTEERCCDGHECGCRGMYTNPDPCPTCRPATSEAPNV